MRLGLAETNIELELQKMLKITNTSVWYLKPAADGQILSTVCLQEVVKCFSISNEICSQVI